MLRVCMYCHHYVTPENDRRPLSWDGHIAASHVVCNDDECREKLRKDMGEDEKYDG